MTVTAPYVGLPATKSADACTYAADITSRGCAADAVTHLIIDAPGWGVVGLPSCAPHVGIGRAAGVVLAEHPYGPECAAGTCAAG